MFEPLGDDDSQRGGNKKTMRIIWVVIGVVTLVLIVVSFM